MADEKCHCGKPLHYSSPKLEALVRRVIAEAGGDPLITVTTPMGSWRVQRHYIALHGLVMTDLPFLGFEQVE